MAERSGKSPSDVIRRAAVLSFVFPSACGGAGLNATAGMFRAGCFREIARRLAARGYSRDRVRDIMGKSIGGFFSEKTGAAPDLAASKNRRIDQRANEILGRGGKKR